MCFCKSSNMFGKMCAKKGVTIIYMQISSFFSCFCFSCSSEIHVKSQVYTDYLLKRACVCVYVRVRLKGSSYIEIAVF